MAGRDLTRRGGVVVGAGEAVRVEVAEHAGEEVLAEAAGHAEVVGPAARRPGALTWLCAPRCRVLKALIECAFTS